MVFRVIIAPVELKRLLHTAPPVLIVDIGGNQSLISGIQFTNHQLQVINVALLQLAAQHLLLDQNFCFVEIILQLCDFVLLFLFLYFGLLQLDLEILNLLVRVRAV